MNIIIMRLISYGKQHSDKCLFYVYNLNDSIIII